MQLVDTSLPTTEAGFRPQLLKLLELVICFH
jgi:hypothetical protein